ncbi:MAG: DNA-3-methyladenine glycosylase I [Phycisphaerae bacterium]|nr:DNA-3-methyladenine glycosylase I [Phycisphaerae bacterium]
MNELERCPWCGTDPQYVAYHDEEWGVPVREGTALFAKLILDTFQSGLSWLVVLRKRQAILELMDDLDPYRLAGWDSSRIEQLLGDDRVIRNRAKIKAAVSNARCYLELEQTGASFSDLLWAHVGGQPIINARNRMSDIVDRTPESESMARELKALGFKWTGPVVCYAFMQAVGMVNDHLVSCHRYTACRELS